MKAKHYAALVASVLFPMLAAFFSNWDGKVTSASIVAGLVAALNIWLRQPDKRIPPINVAGLLLLAGLSGATAACLKAVPVIGPTVSCVSTIVADALRGMSLDDILKDAGPTCVQSIDQVIAILVGESARNPMVRETAAYRDQRTVSWVRAQP